MAIFREAADADFHEAVAKEHLTDGMPIIEFHRNHGIPLAAVRKWIELYRDGGRKALNAAADVIKQADAKPMTARQLAACRTALHGTDTQKGIDAIITIARRNLTELADELLAAMLESPARYAIDGIRTLKSIGATEQLARAKSKLPKSYGNWF